MRAEAAVVAEVSPNGGATRLTRLRSSAPLALRAAAGSVWLVGSAGGPVAGDRLTLRVGVGAGSALTVRSTAAMVVLGGGGEEDSSFHVEVEVGPGAVLRWLVEPAVATRGCRHRSTATIRLATGAALVWREELVAGRAGESPGRFDMRLDVEREDRPLLRQELHIGPGAAGWASPAVLGASKASGMVVVVDPAAGPVAGAPVGDHAAVLPLASGGAMVSATASGVVALRRALDEGMAQLGV